MQLVDVAELGRRAAQLLGDPLFVEAIARAEQMILDEWSTTEPRESDRREELHAELRALRRFRGRLRAMEIDGRQVDEKRRMRA